MSEECAHVDSWFSRTLCPEPCGMMHNYCTECGTCIDECASIGAQLRLDERFAELRALGENWDSYGGRPLQPGVEERARKILADLTADPLICMNPDGGVTLEWNDEEVCVYVDPAGGLGASFSDRELTADEDRQLRCPQPMCPSSFVGLEAERKLIDHYSDTHAYWQPYREKP